MFLTIEKINLSKNAATFESCALCYGAKYDFCTEILMNPSSMAPVDSKKRSGYPEHNGHLGSVPFSK